MKKTLLAIPLALALVGCGSKYPDQAVIQMPDGMKDASGQKVSGLIIEMNSNLLDNMEELLEMRDEINAYTSDPEGTQLSFWRDLSREDQAALDELKNEAAQARAAQMAQYTAWRDTTAATLEQARTELGELQAEAARYHSFREEASNRLSVASEAIKEAEARQQDIGQEVREHTNQRIIDEQWAIRQLSENRSALSWQESTWPADADLSDVECGEREQRVTLDLLDEYRTCVYIHYPIAELANEAYDEMLREAMTEYMTLSHRLGQSSSWSRSATGLHLEVSDAKDALAKATILAENQTGQTERALNQNLRVLESRVQETASRLAQADEEVSEGHFPHYTGVSTPSNQLMWARMNTILHRHLDTKIEQLIERSIINQVPFSPFGEAEGLTGKADFLVAPIDITVQEWGAYGGYERTLTTGFLLSLAEEEPVIEDGRLIVELSDDDIAYGTYRDEPLSDLLYDVFEYLYYSSF